MVIDPQDGGVLALASVPSYDPNGFVLGFSEKERAALRSETQRPLLSRAAEGETCQKEIDRKANTLGRINRDSREAKEIRSLTRKLERCLREKSKRTPPVPDQHDAAD